jgi:hypothetical protein
MKGWFIIIMVAGCLVMPCLADTDIALYQGWNFVSVPVLNPVYQYPDYQFYSVFSKVDTAGHSSWRYNAATGNWDKLYPNSSVSPLDGIWVFSNNTLTVPVQGDNAKAPAPKQVYPGWNAIGFAGTETPSGDAFGSLSGTWQILLGYSGQFQQYERTVFDSEPTRNIFAKPGQGYWLYANQPGQYSLSPVTGPTPAPTTEPVTSIPTTVPSSQPTTSPTPTTTTTIPTTQPTIMPSPTPTGLQPGTAVSSKTVFGTQFLWYQYLLTIHSNGTTTQADMKTEISSDPFQGTPAVHYKNTLVLIGQGTTIITDIYYDTTFDNILGGTITSIINGLTTTNAIPADQLKKDAGDANFQKETTLIYQGRETVTVPAGTFDADKYTATTDNGNATYWVAQGVPVPVKYYILSTDGSDVTAELEGWG